MVSEHESGQVAVAAAEVYEEFFVPALFAEWPARVLQAAAVQNGDAVLDVACGTGILAREAVKRVGASGSVVGIDINEGMLAVARRKAADISWKAAPAENLPFDARSFDRVVSQFGSDVFRRPKAGAAGDGPRAASRRYYGCCGVGFFGGNPGLRCGGGNPG